MRVADTDSDATSSAKITIRIAYPITDFVRQEDLGNDMGQNEIAKHLPSRRAEALDHFDELSRQRRSTFVERESIERQQDDEQNKNFCDLPDFLNQTPRSAIADSAGIRVSMTTIGLQVLAHRGKHPSSPDHQHTRTHRNRDGIVIRTSLTPT